jgi:hypothetical protein
MNIGCGFVLGEGQVGYLVKGWRTGRKRTCWVPPSQVSGCRRGRVAEWKSFHIRIFPIRHLLTCRSAIGRVITGELCIIENGGSLTPATVIGARRAEIEEDGRDVRS